MLIMSNVSIIRSELDVMVMLNLLVRWVVLLMSVKSDILSVSLSLVMCDVLIVVTLVVVLSVLNVLGVFLMLGHFAFKGSVRKVRGLQQRLVGDNPI